MRPCYIERRDSRVILQHAGKQVNARKVAVVHMTKRQPERFEFKFVGSDPMDLRWKNFEQRVFGRDRVCPECGVHHQKPGRGFLCGECQVVYDKDHTWAAAIKAKYGVTAEDYDEIIALQGGGCAICGVSASRKRLAVDHCHTTGKVRGVVCAKCNTGLGLFGDSPKRMLEAAKYLLKYKPPT